MIRTIFSLVKRQPGDKIKLIEFSTNKPVIGTVIREVANDYPLKDGKPIAADYYEVEVGNEER